MTIKQIIVTVCTSLLVIGSLFVYIMAKSASITSRMEERLNNKKINKKML